MEVTEQVEQTADAKVVIRSPRPTDQSYIASTWVDSMALGKSKHKRSELNVLIDRLLDDQTVRVRVASEPTKTDTILGWICYTPTPSSRVLHYVYVREKMRRRGIAAALYRRAFPRGEGRMVYTMRGPDADRLLVAHPMAIHLPINEFLGE